MERSFFTEDQKGSNASIVKRNYDTSSNDHDATTFNQTEKYNKTILVDSVGGIYLFDYKARRKMFMLRCKFLIALWNRAMISKKDVLLTFFKEKNI